MTHPSKFRPAAAPGALHSDDLCGDARVLPFREDLLLVKATNNGLTLCHAWPRQLSGRPLLLCGHIAQPDRRGVPVEPLPCYGAQLGPAGPGALAQHGPAGHAFRDLRSLFGLLSEDEYAAAVCARELLHFDECARHCSRCGTALVNDPQRLGRRCGACGHESEPALRPVVLLLIHDGPRVLLAQPPGLPKELFTLPAVEAAPAESLERTGARFLRETLGIDVVRLRYHESQPWPYPDRLLLGFHGAAVAPRKGPPPALRPDPREFAAARWFHIDDLPGLPPPISLARRMIDWYAQLPRSGEAPELP